LYPTQLLPNRFPARFAEDLEKGLQLHRLSRIAPRPDQDSSSEIHGGFLLDATDPDEKRYMVSQGIVPFDLLVVNLYPFERVVKERDVTLRRAAENVDIGGPAMIRAAAKSALLNKRITVLTNPDQYQDFIEEMEKNNGNIPERMKIRFAKEVFALTSRYDLAIEGYLSRLGES
jgi:phosphoribosylaminoimidazolecarboxamide formyltransferase/IMP cyclohydrolase